MENNIHVVLRISDSEVIVKGVYHSEDNARRSMSVGDYCTPLIADNSGNPKIIKLKKKKGKNS